MFKHIYDKHSWDEVKKRIYNSTPKDVEHILHKEYLHPDDFYSIFSPAADSYLEEMAALSHKITRARFGNVIQLYAPLYVSNECTNSCVYCGFNVNNNIRRVTLSPELIEKECSILYSNGFRHILIVSGEHKKAMPISVLSDISNKIHKKFASISIEVYPMNKEEYGILENSGVDGLTLYQETYNKSIYSKMHQRGPKKDFFNRLVSPEHGGDAGFRRIGIGALLGLSDWRVEGFFTALHAYYLMNKYWRSQILVSFPRLRKASGNFVPPSPVSDRELTHLACAMRILLPDAGLVLSTRESSYFRDNIMPLGITTMSAGSKTEPGGYSHPDIADEQFHVEDTRPPHVIAAIIEEKGFDPVWKDWDREFLS